MKPSAINRDPDRRQLGKRFCKGFILNTKGIMKRKPYVNSALGSICIIGSLLLGGLFVGPKFRLLAQSQYYWDATSPITASPGSGGTGNWNTNAANTVWWVSGTADSAWTNGTIANFAGTAGTVTVGRILP